MYVGVTANLEQRVQQHRSGEGSAFARKYGLTRLVYAERHEDIRAAIPRETSIKRWPWSWKVRMIQTGNPEWTDLG